MLFITFMTSNRGRMMRVVAGLVLLSAGLIVVKDVLGMILALIAPVPIAGGLFDFYQVGVLMGYPFHGAEARKQIAQEQHKP